ncbi:MAG TPA: hypothetical protein VFQ44_00885 [Streptosporangiaceae bacterium]|nr:hypothetical protein [Streptosporangiaceae bacterium]
MLDGQPLFIVSVQQILIGSAGRYVGVGQRHGGGPVPCDIYYLYYPVAENAPNQRTPRQLL